MKCPKCGSENCQIITETRTAGKDYSAGKGICGTIFSFMMGCGPIGVLCGFCGEGKTTTTTNYWICNSCGKKWRA